MIEDYGMGTQLFLAKGSGSEALTSQAALHRRDEEQQGLVDQAQFEARMLIVENRATLERLAEALLSKETLLRREIEEIMGTADAAPAGAAGEERDVELESDAVVEEILEPVEVNGALNGSVGPPPPKPSIPPPVNGNGALPHAEPAQG
jgi:cell division protease FtsH